MGESLENSGLEGDSTSVRDSICFLTFRINLQMSLMIVISRGLRDFPIVVKIFTKRYSESWLEFLS